MGLFDGTPLERPVTCPNCEKALDQCACPRDATGALKPPSRQQARVSREKRGGGKIVTIVTGLDPVATDLATLLKLLKKRCATGGTVAEAGIEIQGDHREVVLQLLIARGYPAKISGG